MNSDKTIAIIVAAGSGIRMGSDIKKQYIELVNIPILSRTVIAFDKNERISKIVLVIPKTDFEYCQNKIIDPFGFKKEIVLVEGADERQTSVFNGLKHIRETIDSTDRLIVLIHDGVRPFVEQSVISESIASCISVNACIPALKISDTVKKVNHRRQIELTLNRDELYQAQTPQAFKFSLIYDAYEHALKTQFHGTDDASLVEHLGHDVHIIPGSKFNLKITQPDDLILGKFLAENFK